MKFIERIKNNKFLKFIFSTFKVIISIVIILIILVIFVQRISGNKLKLGGFSLYTIVSGSMIPVYNVSDMVLAKDVDPKTIMEGDNVVYIGKTGDFKDKIVTHQVIDVRYNKGKYYFTTKGIANDIADPEISQDDIEGKVLSKCHTLSFLSKLVNNLYGFYFLLFVPFVVLLFFEVVDIINERKSLKELQNEKKNKSYRG